MKPGKMLGKGAYGRVDELQIDGDPTVYAGKQFSDLTFGPDDLDVFWKKFAREFRILTSCRHPNIVCYYRVIKIHGSQSKLPVHVMERLSTDLHKYLEKSQQSLPVPSQVTILSNIASGLKYLHDHDDFHGPGDHGIIHRDLTARNVLLTSDGVAKISDFGNSRFVPNASSECRMTSRPGAADYMPPEATDRTYTKSIDIFSFGHLALFVATQVYPGNLSPVTYTVDGRLKARSEVERRREYFKKLNRHPLTDLISQCLDNCAEKRPPADKLLVALGQIPRSEPPSFVRDYTRGNLSGTSSESSLGIK